MRIPLQVIDNGMATVIASLSAPKYRVRSCRVEFIVDTGSTETIISERDTLGFSFSTSSLQVHRGTKIMNVNFNLHKMENVSLAFLTDEPAKVERLDSPSILVSRATKRDPKNMNEAYKIPSLLGIDFLLKNKFRLFLSSSEKKAYLEKIE